MYCWTSFAVLFCYLRFPLSFPLISDLNSDFWFLTILSLRTAVVVTIKTCVWMSLYYWLLPPSIFISIFYYFIKYTPVRLSSELLVISFAKKSWKTNFKNTSLLKSFVLQDAPFQHRYLLRIERKGHTENFAYLI